MNGGNKRFGQGNDVNRARPHIFHRDYWPLKLIHEGVTRFFEEHTSSLDGKRVGSGESDSGLVIFRRRTACDYVSILATYPDCCMANGLHELGTLRLLKRLLRSGDHFVDLGANIGSAHSSQWRRTGWG